MSSMRARRLSPAVLVLALVAASTTLLPAATAARPAATTGPQGAAAPMSRVASPHAVPTSSPTAYCRRVLHYSCYDVNQIAHAYGIDTLHRRGLTGRGRTIVIVDAYGSPTVRRDLEIFSRQYGLPAPQLTITYPAGHPAPYRPTAKRQGWALETSLDTQIVHAFAPRAKIVLAIARSNQNGPLFRTVAATAIAGRGDVLSQSFGEPEPDSPAQVFIDADRAYARAAATRTTFFASTGDYGVTGPRNNGGFFRRKVVQYPASSPHVVAVGGTQLHLDGRGHRIAPDNVWNDEKLLDAPIAATGGRSAVFARPAYQAGVRNRVDAYRGVPDVSFTSALDGGVLIYLGYLGKNSGYYVIYGTSVACPTMAAMVALADEQAGHRLGQIQPALYAHAAALTDVNRGNNTVSVGRTTVRGYYAVHGYDLASGLGTAQAPALVAALTAHG